MGKGLLNGVIFNISWLVLLLTHSNLVAPLLVLVHLLVHRTWFVEQQREWQFIGLVTLGGLLLDQLIFAAGILTVNDQASLPPLWLGCLWPIFATTLNHAFKPLQQRLLLAALLGGIGGTGSYIAGVRISDVTFGDPFWGPAGIAIIWTLLMPVLSLAAGRWMQPKEIDNGTATA